MKINKQCEAICTFVSVVHTFSVKYNNTMPGTAMIKSLPPLQDVAAMAGLELPKYLGEATNKDKGDGINQP